MLQTNPMSRSLRTAALPGLACVVLLTAAGLEARAAGDAERPNVLMIAIDDLNDWVGCLAGHPQADTPAIDGVARRGVLFTNAHTSVPVCSPSRTSLMSGKEPFRSGVFTNGQTVFDLGGKYTTLPEHFAANGYRTLGAGKLFHGSSGKYAQSIPISPAPWSVATTANLVRIRSDHPIPIKRRRNQLRAPATSRG